jgi:hypothetical protein
MLYRTIWLLLDSVHRLVCGSFTKRPQRFGDWICLRPQVDGDQWLRLALYDGPNWIGLPCPIHLRTETDPVSETLWSFCKASTYQTMDRVQKKFCMNIPASKVWPPEEGPQRTKWSFSGTRFERTKWSFSRTRFERHWLNFSNLRTTTEYGESSWK